MGLLVSFAFVFISKGLKMKTYAAVQHAPQKISIDQLENGKYVCQVSFWFANRGDAKIELERLCSADNVLAYSKYVVGLSEIK